ncbi:MAG TPA: hypothetical protein PLB16_11165 [bacterium]|nr:hypothetical protein [bacterium]
MENQTKNRKEIAKSYETHGAVLIALSIPMFVIAIGTNSIFALFRFRGIIQPDF